MAQKIRLDTKGDLNGEYVPSDSEDEYSPREKKLLDKYRQGQASDSDSEQQVYGFSASDSENDDGAIADSDVEGQEASGDDMPDAKAWGKRKKSFYNTDYVDQDYGGFGKDEEIATLEEQEAKALQRRLTEQLGDEDFSLEFFSSKRTNEKTSDDAEILIKSDLSQMSKRQKLQLLQKESPEFLGLIEDFREKISIAKDVLRPSLNLFKEKNLPECPATDFVKTYYETILNYCTNVSFYVLLKTKKVSIQSHPITKRLFQYRQILKQMEPLYLESMKPQLDSVLQAKQNGEPIEIISAKRKSDRQSNSASKKLKLDKKNKLHDNPEDEDVDGDDYMSEEKETDLSLSHNATSDNEYSTEGEKRAITYQIAKNKGLTPRRKKEQRNPRVKHRNKYRKAKIRRKGAVREVRTETSRYAGEISGIKSNVKKSIKIK